MFEYRKGSYYYPKSLLGAYSPLDVGYLEVFSFEKLKLEFNLLVLNDETSSDIIWLFYDKCYYE